MSMWTRLICPCLGPVDVRDTENVGCLTSVTEKASLSLHALSSSKILCLLGLVVGSEQCRPLNPKVL
jgi:hypothetical protein